MIYKFLCFLKKNLKIIEQIYTYASVILIVCMNSITVFAADDMWTKAKSIMGDVYTKVLGISTVAAVVTASVALLLMNFSRSGKTVDESRAWLKRIIITWAILNGLGFIMAYVTPLFQGGQYMVSSAIVNYFML